VDADAENAVADRGRRCAKPEATRVMQDGDT
jgi:hypothetical protein